MSIYGKHWTAKHSATKLNGGGSRAMPTMPEMNAPMNWRDKAWPLTNKSADWLTGFQRRYRPLGLDFFNIQCFENNVAQSWKSAPSVCPCRTQNYQPTDPFFASVRHCRHRPSLPCRPPLLLTPGAHDESIINRHANNRIDTSGTQLF